VSKVATARARSILRGVETPGSWQEIEELAHQVAPSDRAVAAQLLLLACRRAMASGENIEATGLAGAAAYIASTFHPSICREAGDVVLVALERVVDPSEYFQGANELAACFTATGLTENGVRLARVAVARAAALPPSESSAVIHSQALSSLASALIRAEHFADALTVLVDARGAVPADAYEVIGNIEFNEGLAQAAVNQIGKARSAYALSRSAFHLGADEVGQAYVDRSEAATLARSGRYGEALELYERALETFSRRQLSLEMDQTTAGLLATLSSLGQRWTEEDLERYETLAFSLPPAESLALGLNVANIAHRQQDAARADRLYQRLAQKARELQRPVDLARCESAYAVALREVGDLDGAWRANRSAAARFEDAGLLRESANTDNNAALLLADLARRTADDDQRRDMRNQAADHALRAIVRLDAFRHSLPEAADRRALQGQVYPHIFAVAIDACVRVERWDEVASLVEKSRIQPVLTDEGGGFVEPAPLAARPGIKPVGDSGTPIVLSDLADDGGRRLGAWHGWWSDGARVVQCRSQSDRVDVDVRDLEQRTLDLFAGALPVVLPLDLAAAGGDEQRAQLLATWRATRGPLLDDAAAAEALESVLPRSVRAHVRSDPTIAECLAMSADELLWRLTTQLFAAHWLDDLRESGESRSHMVVAPPALLGRIPWAALPLSDPSGGTPIQLVEAADVVVGLPATLAGGLRTRSRTRSASKTEGLVIADPLGNLGFARRLQPRGMQTLGYGAPAPATRAALEAALRRGPAMLIVNAHVEPGSDDNPASSALLLRGADSSVDRMRVLDFADLEIPPQCLILGCDGAGAATGTEWTGLATGLVWAGATEVITTTAPVLDDLITARLDAALVEEVRRHGGTDGLLSWQRRMARQRRGQPADPQYAPYRWAQIVALRSG
jgi:tetratricopeptide (TPR) repeat protein